MGRSMSCTRLTPRGVFGRELWLGLLAEAGFDAQVVLEQTTEDRAARELFVGHRPHL